MSSCPPAFVNYLVIQTSDTEDFSTALTEIILPSSTTSFAVNGSPGTSKFVRAKWRRTTDPLEESGWSEFVEITFTTGIIGGGGNGNGEEICGPQQSGLVLQFDGTQAVAQSLASLRCPFKGTFLSWFIDAVPAESAGSNILNVRKNGTTIFPSAFRPALTAPALTATGNTFQVATFEKDDLIQMDVDQIGTAGPRRITLQIQIERDCTTP